MSSPDQRWANNIDPDMPTDCLCMSFNPKLHWVTPSSPGVEYSAEFNVDWHLKGRSHGQGTCCQKGSKESSQAESG